MSKWEEKRLDDLVKVNPVTISTKDGEREIKYIDISSVSRGVLEGYTTYKIADAPSRAKREVKQGDTLFSTVRPNLRAYYYVRKCPDNAVASTGFAVLRAKKTADKRFVYYLVTENSFINWLTLVAKGSAYPAVDSNDFKKAKVTVPDLPTQTRIADILSAYDDAIENNNRRIALLEKATQELYKEWFVRFRFPGHENAKFVNGLPEGWEYVRFGTLAEIIDGDRGENYPKQEEFYSEGYCLFLNAGNVTKSGFAFENNAYITEGKDKALRKGKLARNDIVLTTRGTVGNVAYYNDHIPYDVVRINSGMVILRDFGSVPPEFLYITLRSEYVQKMIELYSSGSAQPQLPIKDMRRMKILKPSKEIVEEFSKVASALLLQASLLQSKSQNLACQRDLLLPRLMSGKLEV